MSKPAPRRRKAAGPIFGSADNGVEKVARILKKTYQIERQRFLERQGSGDPRESAIASRIRLRQGSDLTIEDKHNPDDVWREMARYVIEERIEPEDWIVKQFELQKPMPGVRVWHPNQLLPRVGAIRYKAATQHVSQALAIALKSQADTVRSEIGANREAFKSDADCWLYAVTAYSSELSALFRYCFSLRCYKLSDDSRFASLAHRMEKEAALQYLRHAAVYDEKWGREWIPAGFARKAQAIYKEEYGG